MPANRPWLDKKNWSDNRIASGARTTQWALWGFALLWNLITVPLFIQFESIWQQMQSEPITALAFLFPLVGMILIVMAVRATRKMRHFGSTPLVLDPFPGSLGGHVGGTIETRIPFDRERRFAVSLSCIYSRVTGSGKNRSRSESIKWHGNGVCHSQGWGTGTRLSFRFDVPAELPASDPSASGNYHLWRVNVSTDLEGPDFDRNWEIPVFDTGAQPSGIRQGTESHHATVDAAMDGIHSIADIRPVAGGIEAIFPAMQRPAQGVFALLFGLIFAGVGIGVGVAGESLFLAGIFTLVGSAVAAYGIFYLGKSLQVSVTREGLKSRRFLFGYPMTSRRLSAANFRKFDIKQGGTLQSGKKTTVYYQLFAEGAGTKPFPMAERLTSRGEAELLRETFRTYLGK